MITLKKKKKSPCNATRRRGRTPRWRCCVRLIFFCSIIIIYFHLGNSRPGETIMICGRLIICGLRARALDRRRPPSITRPGYVPCYVTMQQLMRHGVIGDRVRSSRVPYPLFFTHAGSHTSHGLLVRDVPAALTGAYCCVTMRCRTVVKS